MVVALVGGVDLGLLMLVCLMHWLLSKGSIETLKPVEAFTATTETGGCGANSLPQPRFHMYMDALILLVYNYIILHLYAVPGFLQRQRSRKFGED